MFKKHVAREINELQTVNAKLRQSIDANNRDLIDQIEKHKMFENNFKSKFNELTKEIQLLKSEITYWKETAEHFKNEANELESDLHYWQIYALNLKEELNKTLDNENTKC